jgi:hypothetical protein
MSTRSLGASKVALVAAALCLWSSGAAPQQAGTVARETLTFIGGASATMQIEIAGPKSKDTATDVLLEFVPDGNDRTGPPPDPALPAGVQFGLSASVGGARNFPLAGGDDQQTFSDKFVSVRPLDPVNAPGLYSLSITHLKEIAVGTTETWTFQINGLPRQGLRAIAAVRQGTFKSLQPTGVSLGPPTIFVAPSTVPAGGAATLTVNSAGGLDLSQLAPSQVTIAPSDGISNLSVGNATPNSLALSFSSTPCTPTGNRTLTIANHDISASATFAVVLGPPAALIRANPSSMFPDTVPILTVSSSGCFDLSRVTAGSVSIAPPDGISNIRVAAATASSVAISFNVAANATLGSRTLTVGNGTASTTVPLQVILRPPLRFCRPGFKCCATVTGFCTRCVPRLARCP